MQQICIDENCVLACMDRKMNKDPKKEPKLGIFEPKMSKNMI